MSILCWPIIKVCEWMGRHTPKTLVKIRFYAKFKRFPNLKNPQDLNEKILWMKLHSDVSKWVELADKYRVRSYIEQLGLGDNLVKLYGHWENADDIDFTTLPNTVIFKANNGDGKGTNLIVKDVQNSDHNALKKIFRRWLNNKHVGDLGAEPQYKEMNPCIIAEEVLQLPKDQKSLIDYKIWCINEKPLYIFICQNRDEDGGGADVLTYDLEWNPHPEFSVFNSEYRQAKVIPKPKNLDKMLDIATKLSHGFPILRIDLYNIDGKIYFGELTFTSQGGMMDYFKPDFLTKLGQMADISWIKKTR